MIRDPLALCAVIAAVAALSFWLERRFAWAHKLGASLLVIVLGALLSNLQLVTASSPVYDAVSGPVTSLAIVWLLLAVDLRSLRDAGPRMLLAFGIASLATCAGVLTAALSFRASFGAEGWKLSGVMTGTYIGGSINFVAIKREVGLSDSLSVAATAADNLLTTLWMGATLLLPLWIRGLYPARRGTGLPGGETPSAARFFGVAELRIFDVLALLALGLAVLLCSGELSTRIPAVPKVLWLTTLALAAGQVPAMRAFAGALPLGLVALNLFFVTIGIGSRVAEIIRVGPQVFWFTATSVGIHGLLTYGTARLVGLDVETTSVASQAAVGGPSTAMALATARGWPDLVLPGLLAGLLGYAIGNYAGLGIASLVKAMLGG